MAGEPSKARMQSILFISNLTLMLSKLLLSMGGNCSRTTGIMGIAAPKVKRVDGGTIKAQVGRAATPLTIPGLQPCQTSAF